VSALREFTRPRLWLGLWCFGWLLCIALSLIPPPHIDVDVPDGDKIGHFFAYALLAAWGVWIFASTRGHRRAALSLLALGIAIEIAQGTLTSNRMMDARDALADALGIAFGWWLGLRMPGFLQRLDARLGTGPAR
jgi:VanZ family protein